MHKLETVLQDLYNSEINLQISWFWDAGIEVKFGDDLNGWKPNPLLLSNISKITKEIIKETIKLYPESQFAKKYQ